MQYKVRYDRIFVTFLVLKLNIVTKYISNYKHENNVKSKLWMQAVFVAVTWWEVPNLDVDPTPLIFCIVPSIEFCYLETLLHILSA